MTVGELMAALSDRSLDQEVVVSYDPVTHLTAAFETVGTTTRRMFRRGNESPIYEAEAYASSFDDSCVLIEPFIIITK